MIEGLLILLVLILLLPFLFRKIQHNLEYFLFFAGIAAMIISGNFSLEHFTHIFQNYLLYLITGAVLIAGVIFKVYINSIRNIVYILINKVSLKVFIFFLIIILSFLSCIITAIIAALILVEIIHALPLRHNTKISLTIIACFAIGLGAVLTPIGQPLSTIVASSLNVDFFYIFSNLGVYVIPAVIGLAVFGAFYIDKHNKKYMNISISQRELLITREEMTINLTEGLSDVYIRAVKVFIFVVALELLRIGFIPLIDNYIIKLDGRILYWVNMSSAVLNNAPLAAAEISPSMNARQIQAVLLGVLLSGGMLISGNIHNIIAASKINIKNREWASLGIPLGSLMLLAYFVVLFIF